MRSGREKGYTLAACLIFLTILMIGLTAATQVWSHFLRRDDELELIFRGTQYVEAIRIYQQRWGHPPNKLDELVKEGPGKPRCIRRLWEDPITRSDKWGLIFANGMKWPAQAMAPPQGQGLQQGDLPGQTTQPPGGVTGLQQSDMTFHPIGQAMEGAEPPPLPIVGVFCTSTEESIREYNGRRHYNEWEFSVIQNQRGGIGQGQVPGGGHGQPPGTNPGTPPGTTPEGGGRKP